LLTAEDLFCRPPQATSSAASAVEDLVDFVGGRFVFAFDSARETTHLGLVPFGGELDDPFRRDELSGAFPDVRFETVEVCSADAMSGQGRFGCCQSRGGVPPYR